MGIKCLWSGLTLISVSILPIPAVGIVGQVLMVVGLVLFLLDK